MEGKYYSDAKNGKLSKRASQDIKKHIEALEGFRIVITVDKVKKSRSAQQNRYLHLAFGIFKDGLNDLGNTFTMAEVKELLKYKFLKTEVVNESTGEIIGERVKGTAELTTSEMSDFVGHMIQYAIEEFEITIPLPDENLTINYK